MKKILYTLSIALLALLASSCKGNENWVVVEDIQPGVYVTGEATVYSGAAPASALKPLNDLDPAPDQLPPHLVAIYTYLQGDKPFEITIATASDKVEKYGQGNLINESTTAKVYELAVGATPFTVAADGLYRIIVNTESKQAHILPVKWGVIGAATPQGWNSETPLTDMVYDPANYTVTYKGIVVLTPGEYKFRYSGDWGYIIESQPKEIKYHTNVGGTADGVVLPVSGGLVNSKPGGSNLTNKMGGEYELSLVYKLRDRTFQVSAKLLGEPTPPPAVTLPENMYLIGSINNWSWDTALEMVPVYGMVGPDGDKGTSKYWTIRYLAEGDAFKANGFRSWDNALSADNLDKTTIENGLAEKDGNGNIKVKKAGWYLVVITSKIVDDALAHTIELLPPNIYFVGPGANDTWGTPNDYLFDIPTTRDGVFVSPAAAMTGEFRMALALEGVEWWKTEFLVRDGVLEIRGNGPDQMPRLEIKAGQKVKLNFTNLTGSVQ